MSSTPTWSLNSWERRFRVPPPAFHSCGLKQRMKYYCCHWKLYGKAFCGSVVPFQRPWNSVNMRTLLHYCSSMPCLCCCPLLMPFSFSVSLINIWHASKITVCPCCSEGQEGKTILTSCFPNFLALFLLYWFFNNIVGFTLESNARNKTVQ